MLHLVGFSMGSSTAYEKGHAHVSKKGGMNDPAFLTSCLIRTSDLQRCTYRQCSLHILLPHSRL